MLSSSLASLQCRLHFVGWLMECRRSSNVYSPFLNYECLSCPCVWTSCAHIHPGVINVQMWIFAQSSILKIWAVITLALSLWQSLFFRDSYSVNLPEVWLFSKNANALHAYSWFAEYWLDSYSQVWLFRPIVASSTQFHSSDSHYDACFYRYRIVVKTHAMNNYSSEMCFLFCPGDSVLHLWIPSFCDDFFHHNFVSFAQKNMTGSNVDGSVWFRRTKGRWF